MPKSKKQKSIRPEFPRSLSPIQILDALQNDLQDHIKAARQIHADMITVRRLFGVEYEIKALSLVG